MSLPIYDVVVKGFHRMFKGQLVQGGAPVSNENPLPISLEDAATATNQESIITSLADILAELESQDTGAGQTLTIRLDEVSDTLFYVGKAAVGSVDADAAWQVVRYTTPGVVLKAEYANGSDGFTNVWDNRATLTYI